ncbi:MAG: hypothetical protein KatS3mg032_2213 [Cyclobacteriaceae bacterium]|nr:MAG: hypothetical protein KatS3mg032_2213 [Cyclobacteriaceae bacterium]
MERISKIIIDNKTIVEVHYANLRDQDRSSICSTILLASSGREPGPCNVIKYLNDRVFITPAVHAFGKKILKKNSQHINKLCFVGLTATHKILLKGFNIFMQRNFRSFSTRQEALNFILDPASTDDDLPEYYKAKKS